MNDKNERLLKKIELEMTGDERRVPLFDPLNLEHQANLDAIYKIAKKMPRDSSVAMYDANGIVKAYK